jgi:hypothetical protein
MRSPFVVGSTRRRCFLRDLPVCARGRGNHQQHRDETGVHRAGLSFDEGKTWPQRRLIATGGPARTLPGIDRNEFTMSNTMAETCGYLAAIQTRDGNIQLISSKEHYVFNLAWLKALPPPPKP